MASNVYAGATVLATFADGGIHYKHGDWIGSERARTLTNGVRDTSFQSLSFGDGRTDSPTGDTDGPAFALLDKDPSGTFHADNRQYSSVAGRWMSPDPYTGSFSWSDPQSFNRYAYVGSNPLSWLDPSGWAKVYGCQTITVYADGSVDGGDPYACGGGPGGGFIYGSTSAYGVAEHQAGAGSASGGGDDDARIMDLARGINQGAGALSSPTTYAAWFGGSLFVASPFVAASVSELPVVTVVIGKGTPFHVAFGTVGLWLHAGGTRFFNMTITSERAEAFVRAFEWYRFNVPVLNPQAVLNTAGQGASSCVTGACYAIFKGWVK